MGTNSQIFILSCVILIFVNDCRRFGLHPGTELADGGEKRQLREASDETLIHIYANIPFVAWICRKKLLLET